ncbi:hypothetical protein B9Q01_10270, partial [Candidatus Marsarchaeota G1 archaeon OSP_D]
YVKQKFRVYIYQILIKYINKIRGITSMIYYRIDPINFSVWREVDDTVNVKIKERVQEIIKRLAKTHKNG